MNQWMMNSDWSNGHSSLIGYLSLTALSQSELSFQPLFVVCLNAFEQHTFSNRAMKLVFQVMLSWWSLNTINKNENGLVGQHKFTANLYCEILRHCRVAFHWAETIRNQLDNDHFIYHLPWKWIWFDIFITWRSLFCSIWKRFQKSKNKKINYFKKEKKEKKWENRNRGVPLEVVNHK